MNGEKEWLISAWIDGEDGDREKVEYFIYTDAEENMSEVMELAHAELFLKHGGYLEMEVSEGE